MISLIKGIVILTLVAVAGFMGMMIMDKKGIPVPTALRDEAAKLVNAVKPNTAGDGLEKGAEAKTQAGKGSQQGGPLDEADKALTKSAKVSTPPTTVSLSPVAENLEIRAEGNETNSDARVSDMTATYEKTAVLLDGIK